MKKLILAIAIFLGASPLWAELMTYQGRLKEAGIPASGNRLFTFEFCDQEDGSGVCLVAPGTPANFAVANGLFKSTITIHPSVDLAAGAWYLRVTVGSSVLAPLERLTAVPYSVFASSAGHAAYAEGTLLKAGDTMTGQLTLAGSTLTVTGNEFSVGGSTFVVKSGYVGIGTASPNNPLEVHTNGQYVFTGVATGASAVLNLVPQTGGTVMLNNNAVGPVALAVGHTKHLLVDESGNVGISSVTPSYRLVVSSGAGEAGTIMAVSTGTSNLFWVEGDGAHATRFHGDGSGLTGVTGATGTDPNALQLTGGTMQGAIDMDGNFLSGVSTITMQGGSIAIVPPGTGGTNVGYGISIGSNSYSNSDSGIGIGYSAYLNSYYSVGLGAFASENGSYGVGIGAFASRNYNSGVGVGAEASENFQNGTGIGHSAKNNDNYGVGVGAYAQNNDNYAVGVGAYSQYNAGFGAALGAYSYASSSATALGAQAKANAELSLALGYGTVNNSTGTASFGSYGVSAPYYQVSGSTVLALGGGLASNTLKVGPMAGAVNYGQFNVFVGSAAGKVNSSGIHNVLVGHDAGSANITGTGNTFIGSAAGSANISGLQNIVIGYNQQTSASDSASELNIGGLIFGQLGVKTVGISTRAPQAALDIVSTGTAHTQMAQIWRDSTGLIVGSMSVTGSLQAVRFIGDGSGLTGVTSAGAVQKAGDTMTGPLHILSDDLLSDTSDFITTGLVISTGGAIRTTGIGHGTVAGNARGIGAVDLQTVRALSAQTASGSYSVLSGGFRNTSSSIYSTVGGGYTNSASGVAAVVGGGWENSATGLRSVISGGETNSASAYYSTVGGGIDNVVSGHSSAVSGGVFNVVSGSNSVVGGGAYNTVVGTSAVVAGGEYNIASGMHSSAGGGLSNTAVNAYSYVGGGQGNTASANHAVVAGGQGNAAISAQSAVAGGAGNRAEAQYAFVGGGNDNRASGMYATVPGGYNNTAKANYSFAAGGRSSSTAQGAFTWQDSGGAAINLVNDVTDRTVFKSRGGFLVTGSTNTSMTGPLDRGVFITGEGRVGISTGAPQAALDVLAAGNTVSDYTQIWRDSDGVTRASVTATGVFYGDGSGLTNLPAAAGSVLKSGDTMTGPLSILSDDLLSDTSDFITTGIVISTGGAIRTTGLGHGSAVGNARGMGAVDLQTYRALGAQVASGKVSSIGGGQNNTASGDYSTVSGGVNNTASGPQATVSGGQSNMASLGYATVSGGYENTALQLYVTVSGGYQNRSSGTYATITGGSQNTANGIYATVSGGQNNSASGGRATVSGGAYNTAIGQYSWAGGYRSSSTANGAFTWSDSKGYEIRNTAADRALFKTEGGFMVVGSTVAGNPVLPLNQGMLDIISTGTTVNQYAQVWRDSDGVTRASVTATGVFYGDGSGLTGVTSAGAVQKTGDFMSGQLTTLSTITVQGNAFSVGVSTFFVDSGLVGVGTATPSALLSVVQKDVAAPLLPLSVLGQGTGGIAHFVTDNSSSDGVTIALMTSSPTKYALNITANNGANTVLSVRGDGKISMGSTGPASKFDVYNGSITTRGTSAGLVLSDASRTISPETDPALGAGIRISTNVYVVGFSSAARYYGDGSGLTGVTSASAVQKTGDTMTGALLLPQGTAAVPSLSFSGDENTGFYSPGQDQLAFATAGTERLRVTDAGRVGIGIASPAEALDISGRVLISTNAGGNPVTDGLLSNGAGGMVFYSGATKYMHVGYGGEHIGIGPGAGIQSDLLSPQLQLKGSMSVGATYNLAHPPANSLVVENRLGVGTPAPDAALSVVQADVAVSSYTVRVGTSASAYHLVVTTGGWVGINTQRPQAPLHLTAATKDEGIVVEHNSDTPEGSYLALLKARGTANSQAVVQSGDNLGVLAFGGYNASPGDPFPTAAAIVGRVDGVASVHPALDMPGRLEFMTAADGTAEAQTRMVIRSDGGVGIATGAPQAMLDIRSTATVAQIWRDAGGVIRASMTASGVLYAQVDALSSKVSKTGDNMSGNLTISVDPALYTYDFATTGIQVSTAGSIVTVGVGNGISGAGVRGMGAVDLQTAREVSGQVALGDFSTLSGGAYNTVLGSNTVVAGGRYNIAAGTSAVISGGEGNYAASYFGTIGGGKGNSVYGSHSAIFSGQDNLAEEMFAFVGSGYGNTASTAYSVVAGGWMNTAGAASEYYAGVVAGWGNKALGGSSFVGAGGGNHATGDNSVVAGGSSNMATGGDSAVPGGSNNTAKGNYSFAAGYMSSSTANGTFTWADSKGVVVENSVGDQVMFKAAGGFWVSTGTAYADPALYVSNANKVGIGTNTPGFKLHVKDLAGGAIAGLTSSPSSTDAGVYGWSNSAATAIKGVAGSGYAGRFEGNVFITNDGVNPANPARLQVSGDLGLGDGSQIGNTPIVIWLTASTPFVDGDVVIASGNNQFGTIGVASTSTVIGVAIGSGTVASTAKIAVAGVVVANCINGAFGQHAVTSATVGAVGGVGLPSSGTSVGLFLTNCVGGKATLLLK
ncbi:MAG: hypothetical protein AB7V08_02695 [Elusimicrobiales bacterium]